MNTDNQTNFDSILNSFGIKAECVNFEQVDNYFFYDLKLHSSTKVNTIKKYLDEISLALKSPCKPSVKVMHNEGLVRLEFAGPRTSELSFFNYMSNKDIPNGAINCLLGQTVDGQKMWMDLTKNPHMIIAGTTGSGKSTLLHTIIANLFQYNDVELYLADPKQIEFSKYEATCNIPVCYTYADTIQLLKNLLQTMESRYDLIRVGKPVSEMKHIVVIIDEFADLIMQDKDNEFMTLICRLAQKCRAARIHIILTTQRPSTNIINGTIKANFPARIACRVASHIDSKVVLDATGAENLLGKGDALIRDGFRYLERFQVAYTTAEEVCKYFGKEEKAA
jgi:S-DNA-T family DNA segregation ATPase FtsK/SpoIIIE